MRSQYLNKSESNNISYELLSKYVNSYSSMCPSINGKNLPYSNLTPVVNKIKSLSGIEKTIILTLAVITFIYLASMYGRRKTNK